MNLYKLIIKYPHHIQMHLTIKYCFAKNETLAKQMVDAPEAISVIAIELCKAEDILFMGKVKIQQSIFLKKNNYEN